MQRKPEQMHVKPSVSDPAPPEEGGTPAFTLKELIRLNGMKWLQEHGLQYDSAPDDGKDLYLRSNRT